MKPEDENEIYCDDPGNPTPPTAQRCDLCLVPITLAEIEAGEVGFVGTLDREGNPVAKALHKKCVYGGAK